MHVPVEVETQRHRVHREVHRESLCVLRASVFQNTNTDFSERTLRQKLLFGIPETQP